MKCRKGCGACCIAISISSSIPGMPEGKKAGERCVNLSPSNACMIHNTKSYPKVCENLMPSREMCGNNSKEAFSYLKELEEVTRP